jgi:hypothetical protein
MNTNRILKSLHQHIDWTNFNSGAEITVAGIGLFVYDMGTEKKERFRPWNIMNLTGRNWAGG